MQQSLKTLILTLATLGLASCGGGGGGGAGGDFGEPEAAKARTHVCPTSVLALSTPFFKPGGEAKFASGARTLFTHSGGLEGMGAFADAGTVIGVALTPHRRGSDVISPVDEFDFKRFLVARFRATDVDTNQLDIGQLAYVYLATPSNNYTPELLPRTTELGAQEDSNNQSLVAYKDDASFRYKTTESEVPGDFISGKDYLKQRLEEEAVASGASPRQMYNRIFDLHNADCTLLEEAADGANDLGYTLDAKAALSLESEAKQSTANPCQANAATAFTARIGSSRSTVKDELAAMESAMGGDFSPLAEERIRQKAYEHLCPVENRFITYVHHRIDTTDTLMLNIIGSKESRDWMGHGSALMDLFYRTDPTSLVKKIDKNTLARMASKWNATKSDLSSVGWKIMKDSGNSTDTRWIDAEHHYRWYDAIKEEGSNNNSSRIRNLLKDDVDLKPGLSELTWNSSSDGYLKGCFNGEQDWPETASSDATPATLHNVILAEARGQGASCVDSNATVETFKADMTAYINAMSVNPSKAARQASTYNYTNHNIPGTDKFSEADYVFPN